MPSPFPGMDPYLERPGLWPDVHHRLISVASDLLLPHIRPRYFVRIEERVYVSDEDDPGRRVIAPDLRLVERPEVGRLPTRAEGVGGTAVVEPVEVVTLLTEEVHEARLEIIDRERDQVVTVIEFVSPTNKTANSRGRESYLRKRLEVMTSPTHWVEIDLLRQGQPVIRRSGVPSFDYAVHVSRDERRPRGRIWPIRLPDPLPVIDIPLRKDDGDVPLDLQSVLNTVYDRAGYDLQLNYRDESDPPLAPEQAAWADTLLRGKGLR